MDYLVSHFIPILIAGVLIAAGCVIWAFCAAHFAKGRDESEDAGFTCGMGCSSCSMFAGCDKEEKSRE